MTTFTDGVIKLSDQITAVTGTGYYCIMLMQDDEIIYSGNGKIIINDHVIGAENIDSVSEADGYTFPDDFYTKDTPLAVLDDSTTSTTSTWSSSKISTGIAGKASIDDNATNLTETWSSDKIATELNGKPDIDDTAQNTTDTWSSEKINSVVQSAAQIADNVISTTSTWSSNKINGEINTASTSAVAQLNAMKTGFDGVTYDSPVEMVQGCDTKLQEEIDDISSHCGNFVNEDVIAYNSGKTYSDTTSDYLWVYNDDVIPPGNNIVATVFRHGFTHKMDVAILDAITHKVLFYNRNISNVESYTVNCGKYEVSTIFAFSYIPSAVVEQGHQMKRSTQVAPNIGDTITYADWSASILAFAVNVNYSNYTGTLLEMIESIPKFPNVHTVKPDGTGDFTSVSAAVDYASAGDTIIVYPGIYDGTIRAFTKEINIIGIDKNTCILRSKKGTYDYPALECSCGYFENLTFLAEYVNGESTEIPVGTAPGAYAVHCENANGADYAVGKNLTFRNCYFRSDFFPAFGCGAQADWKLELDGCTLVINQPTDRSQYVNAGSLGALFFHDAASGTFGHSDVSIHDCIFINKIMQNTMCLYDTNNQDNSVTFIFDRNVLRSAIVGFADSIWWRNNSGGSYEPFEHNFTLDSASWGNSESELNAE